MTGQAIVLVHGLWVNGLDMSLLKYRLQNHGYLVSQFTYHSVLDPPAVNADNLKKFTADIPHDTIHFVAHSLGGLVLRHYFAAGHDAKPGRVVTLGTPHQPSSAARQLACFLPGRMLLGESTRQGLLGDAPAWPAQRELGSIAGTLRLGLGMVLPSIPAPNDGSVAVQETRLHGMRDHVTVTASHFGMLLSERVVAQIVSFFESGQFLHKCNGSV